MGRDRKSAAYLEVSTERRYLNQFSGGEYLFASGDFVMFATEFPEAHRTLGHLCALKAAWVRIFVRDCDQQIAKRFVSQYHGNTKVVLLPNNTALLLGQMVVVEPSGVVKLLFCDDSGFFYLNSPEGLRIRRAMLEFMH